MIFNNLLTVWQVSQTPLTIGHPSTLMQTSFYLRVGGKEEDLGKKTFNTLIDTVRT